MAPAGERGRIPKPPSPVYWAGASLKWWDFGRIACSAPPSPVYWAGASLKWSTWGSTGRTDTQPFPGLLGRGLIEVSASDPVEARNRFAFPGLLGRGLIEVCEARFRQGATHTPSPVYWAGASLKSELHVRSGDASEEPSPVYWAGASLKFVRGR